MAGRYERDIKTEGMVGRIVVAVFVVLLKRQLNKRRKEGQEGRLRQERKGTKKKEQAGRYEGRKGQKESDVRKEGLAGGLLLFCCFVIAVLLLCVVLLVFCCC